MWSIDPELRAYIEENILPLYEAHDAAHGPAHVQTVLENSLALLDGLDVDPNMVYTVAAYHDVGIRAGRERQSPANGCGRTRSWNAGLLLSSGRLCGRLWRTTGPPGRSRPETSTGALSARRTGTWTQSGWYAG